MSAREPAEPKVLEASYVVEARELGSLPAPGPGEIAIAGRSNVGKSTLLNRLAQRGGLARTSKTPGRTRGLIFFDLSVRPSEGPDLPLRFVDLPGYGFAQVARQMRLGWGELVEGYVERRPTLRLVLSLVDARRGIEDEERELYEWLRTHGIVHHVVLTKIDKLPASERGLLRDRVRAALGPDAVPLWPVSAQTGDGIGRLWNAILRAAAQTE